MGTEISQDAFSQSDLRRFHQRLQRETELLRQWLEQDRFANRPAQGGYELEAWLIDSQGRPAPRAPELIAGLPEGWAVPELARFNLEVNGKAQTLRGDALSRMHGELRQHGQRLAHAAGEMGLRLLMIGSHPQAERDDFCLQNMSPMQRYRAINAQIFEQRRKRPIHIDIDGTERLTLDHPDVMLEAATTSFQIHLRCSPHRAALLYNLSKIVSAPLLALSANSPFLFGRDLWAESRIPVFEQAIDVGESDRTKRVSFGIRYAEEDIFEVFAANLQRYPVLLPEVMDTPEQALAHLRLHNGTIWRWNRPLIGFDADGSPHLRIEQRCVPAGPSATDSIANAAFYFGLVTQLAHGEADIVQAIPFTEARANFYRCARFGLDAHVTWRESRSLAVNQLLLEHLLPQAAAGLTRLEIDAAEIDHWLGIVRARVEPGLNGYQWQRRWIARHGRDFHGMIEAYHALQQQDLPIYRWPLN